MHVLLLPSWYPEPASPLNGIFTKEQASALQSAGVQVGVAYAEMSYLRTMTLRRLLAGSRRTGIRTEDSIVTSRVHRWFSYRLPQYAHVSATIDAAKRYMKQYGRPDLIHAHAAIWAGVAARKIAEQYKLPYLLTEHDTRFYENKATPQEWNAAQYAYEKAAYVISVSAKASQFLVEKDLLSSEKLKVIANLVNVDFFSLPPKARPQNSGLRLLAVAFLEERKRFDLLLRAFAIAFPDGGAVLEIAGDGPERLNLEQLAHALGISSRVKFLGFLDRQGVRDALWRANAFVHASDYETFGVVLIEALATGLPVISTACGGPQDIVTPAVGRLVPVNDEVAFADAMIWLKQAYENFDPQFIRNYAIEQFSSTAVTSQLVELYEEVISK